VPVVAWLTFLHFSLFVLGCAVGSFLNVCIYRMATGRSIAWPGSFCGACVRPIAGWHNIPVFSWLLLRGKCAQCGARFSVRYCLVELFTGVLFAGLFALEVGANWHRFSMWIHGGWWYLKWGVFPPASIPFYLAHLILVSLLLVAIGTLHDRGMIPQVVVVAGLLLGLLFAALLPEYVLWPGGVPPLAGLAIVPGVVRLIEAVRPGTLAPGTLGLAWMTGGVLGWPVVAIALLLALPLRRWPAAFGATLALVWLAAPLLRSLVPG
jgi:leader peptidase (prepilin peptidase)/N-methyltransferase